MIHDQTRARHRAAPRSGRLPRWPEHRPAREVHDDRPRAVRHVPAHWPPAEQEHSHRPVAERVAIHAQQDGAEHLLGTAHLAGPLRTDRAPGDHQPDDADPEEPRDEVM